MVGTGGHDSEVTRSTIIGSPSVRSSSGTNRQIYVRSGQTSVATLYPDIYRVRAFFMTLTYYFRIGGTLYYYYTCY